MSKLVLAACCPVVVVCALFAPSCGSRSSDPAPQAAGIPAVAVNGIVVEPDTLDNIVRSSGTVLASEAVDLCAEAAGRIESIDFREGARVRKNDLLVRINDDDLQAQLRKTLSQLQLATEQGDRQRQLLDKSAISKEQYDIAAGLVATLKADRDNLLATIRKREIRAPFEGVVGLRYVSTGSYVTPSTRIASMQQINPLKVDFGIPEKFAGEVSVGDVVECTSGESRLKFPGKVYAIEPRIDPSMGSLQVRALCENRSGRVYPGAFVQIGLRLGQITDALMVPTQAVIPVLKGQTLLVRRGGVVVSLPVTTGIRTSTSVQITSGLAAGDTVITSGIMQLRPGMRVSVRIP